MREIVPNDIERAAESVATALRLTVDADWSVRAGELEWDVAQTVVHLLGAPAKYALCLASRSTRFIALRMDRYHDATQEELVNSIAPVAAALATVAAAAPKGTMAYHAYGMTDAAGFIAKGCVEMLVHGWDVTRGLGVHLDAPEDVCAAVLGRLHPWVNDADRAPWDELLWITGRIDLPGRPRQTRWVEWHPPRDEWDGTIPAGIQPAVEWIREGAGWRPIR